MHLNKILGHLIWKMNHHYHYHYHSRRVLSWVGGPGFWTGLVPTGLGARVQWVICGVILVIAGPIQLPQIWGCFLGGGGVHKGMSFGSGMP